MDVAIFSCYFLQSKQFVQIVVNGIQNINQTSSCYALELLLESCDPLRIEKNERQFTRSVLQIHQEKHTL
jgi:hypothetical protein